MSIDSTGGDGDDSRPLLEKLADRETPYAETRLLMGEIRVQLREAIAELPDRQRQCVLMYYGKEMSLAEIAEVYGVTVSRISQIISGARKTLRKKLAPMVDSTDLAIEASA